LYSIAQSELTEEPQGDPPEGCMHQAEQEAAVSLNTWYNAKGLSMLDASGGQNKQLQMLQHAQNLRLVGAGCSPLLQRLTLLEHVARHGQLIVGFVLYQTHRCVLSDNWRECS
jgi:hypothetical protein